MARSRGRVCLGRENICKNCIKEDVCKIAEDFYKQFVGLPCKVGDTVYYITGIGHNLVKTATIKEIIIDKNGIKDLYVQGNGHNFESPFVSTFYLTKEEAEQALKESENNDRRE